MSVADTFQLFRANSFESWLAGNLPFLVEKFALVLGAFLRQEIVERQTRILSRLAADGMSRKVYVSLC